MADNRIIECMERAHYILGNLMAVKPGEEVLIVTDPQTDERMTQAMAAAANDLGAEWGVYMMPIRGKDKATIFPKSLELGMDACDVFVGMTTASGAAIYNNHLKELINQKKLREETERAEDSGRLKSAFLANMTHEIRTPLNAIVGFSDLLQVIDNDDERREFIRIIRSNCDMLLRLINDILEASSMGQTITIDPIPIDLPPVFDDICQTLEQRVQGTGVEFQKDNPYDSLPVVMDKGRLQQLLTNFVTNAVKYTTEGHIRVGYRKESRDIDRQRQDGLCFYCEDTGAGIPKEKQAAVFERFVKLNDFVQGTGLGLAICKAIIDRCGGRIGVTSEGEGHGSTFWFWLPNEIVKK